MEGVSTLGAFVTAQGGLYSFYDPRSQKLKFLVSRRDHTDLLYAVEYQWLSVFNEFSAQDLQVMADLASQQAQSTPEIRPLLQACQHYCQGTKPHEPIPTVSMPKSSLFMEFYRNQSQLEREQSIDRFMKHLFPQRQALDFGPLSKDIDLLLLGESHDEQGTKDFLIQHLGQLKAQGFTALACEFISADDQDFLDQYQPQDSARLRQRILWQTPDSYVHLIDQAVRAGLRPIGIGERLSDPLWANGFITENRNFQLAHHVMEFLQAYPQERLVVLVGANHAGYSPDVLDGVRVIPRAHPVPDIPTLVHKYLPQKRLRTVIVEGNHPSSSTRWKKYTWRYVENEIAQQGAGLETFMVEIPRVWEGTVLTPWERRYDYYVHLPQRV